MPPARYVAVLGPGDATDEQRAIAYEVGRLLAERGVVVVTGGLGGVMAAACAGCADAGGLSVGLLPGPRRTEDDAPATITIPTGLGELRNGLVVRAADAVIAVGGSWGTLSEIALAQRLDVPLVSIRGWQVTDGDGAPVPSQVADSALDAVQAVLPG